MLVGILLYPKVTQLDLTGPYEVLTRAPNTQVCTPLTRQTGDLDMYARHYISSLQGICVVGGWTGGGASTSRHAQLYVAPL
jgi:putative intracellular protease/amidase